MIQQQTLTSLDRLSKHPKFSLAILWHLPRKQQLCFILISFFTPKMSLSQASLRRHMKKQQCNKRSAAQGFHVKHVILLMAEILHQLGCMKPYKDWDKLPINWFRISVINSTLPFLRFFQIRKRQVVRILLRDRGVWKLKDIGGPRGIKKRGKSQAVVVWKHMGSYGCF